MAAVAASPAGEASGAPVETFEEVEARPAAVCWKCKGSGKKVSKVAPATAAQADAHVVPGKGGSKVVHITCPICNGTGSMARARVRPADAPPRVLKEFPGWKPVGPTPPHHPSTDASLQPARSEDLSYLTGQWRIFQKAETHRYSTDDVVTAWVAWRAAHLAFPTASSAPAVAASTSASASASAVAGATDGSATLAPPLKCLDIGCGIGSVLLMTAWLQPRATCIGVEAQAARAAQAARSIRYNGVEGRVCVRNGDLRDPGMVPEGATFDVITGTPPYFNVADSALPGCEESARCLFEYRGGIEEYTLAAARLLAPRGLFVVCEGALSVQRGYTAAAAAGLQMLARIDAIPKAGKPPLFIVFIMARPDAGYTAQSAIATFDSLSSLDCAGPGDAPSDAATPLFTAAAFAPHGHAPYPSESDETDSTGSCASTGVRASSAVPALASAAAAPCVSVSDACDGDARAGDGQPPAAKRARRSERERAVAAFPGSLVGELIVKIVVRDTAAERTPAYRLLLKEMGKPS